jgi:NitT/TauT family transport system permease protein
MTETVSPTGLVRRRVGDVVFALAVAAVVAYGAYRVISYISAGVGFGEVGHATVLGLATFARVIVVVVV